MRSSVLLVVVMLAGFGSAASAHDEDGGPGQAVFKVDGKGVVKIGDPLMIGGLTVPKGRYLLEHRVEGTEHVIVLTRADAKGSDAWTHEFAMRLIPEKQVAKRSAIFASELRDGSLGLSAIQIAGEAGDHVLSMPASQ